YSAASPAPPGATSGRGGAWSRRDHRRARAGDHALEARPVALEPQCTADGERLLELASARRMRARGGRQLGRAEGRDRQRRAGTDRLGEPDRPPVPALGLLGVPQARRNVSERRRDDDLAQPATERTLAQLLGIAPGPREVAERQERVADEADVQLR